MINVISESHPHVSVCLEGEYNAVTPCVIKNVCFKINLKCFHKNRKMIINSVMSQLKKKTISANAPRQRCFYHYYLYTDALASHSIVINCTHCYANLE